MVENYFMENNQKETMPLVKSIKLIRIKYYKYMVMNMLVLSLVASAQWLNQGGVRRTPDK